MEEKRNDFGHPVDTETESKIIDLVKSIRRNMEANLKIIETLIDMVKSGELTR